MANSVAFTAYFKWFFEPYKNEYPLHVWCTGYILSFVMALITGYALVSESVSLTRDKDYRVYNRTVNYFVLVPCFMLLIAKIILIMITNK